MEGFEESSVKAGRPMELTKERKLTKEEFDKLASEIRTIVGKKLKGHKDGDTEKLLFKK